MSGFLQLPLPRCDPSTALGLPLALQLADGVEKSLMSNYSSMQVHMQNISRLVFPSKFELLIVMNSLKVNE